MGYGSIWFSTFHMAGSGKSMRPRSTPLFARFPPIAEKLNLGAPSLLTNPGDVNESLNRRCVILTCFFPNEDKTGIRK
jgi:hypothetical protein